MNVEEYNGYIYQSPGQVELEDSTDIQHDSKVNMMDCLSALMKKTNKHSAEETRNDSMVHFLKGSPASIAGKERIGNYGKILLLW
jgi:hypothetical protein